MQHGQFLYALYKQAQHQPTANIELVTTAIGCLPASRLCIGASDGQQPHESAREHQLKKDAQLQGRKRCKLWQSSSDSIHARADHVQGSGQG